MSAATAEVTLQEIKQTAVVPVSAPVSTPVQAQDEHGLIPIIFAFLIAFITSTLFVGSIVLWLAIRDSGVLWP